MDTLKPISRRELIACLRRLGFEGPYAGGKHAMMVRKGRRVVIPNLHAPEIGVNLLARILRQAGVSRDEWASLED